MQTGWRRRAGERRMEAAAKHEHCEDGSGQRGDQQIRPYGRSLEETRQRQPGGTAARLGPAPDRGVPSGEKLGCFGQSTSG